MYNFRPGDSFKNFPQNGNPVSQADKAKMDSEVCTTHLPPQKNEWITTWNVLHIKLRGIWHVYELT